MKYNDLTDEHRERVDDYVSRRWDQLSKIDNDIADKVVKYLFLVNAGGAIAVLAFLGTNPDSASTTTGTKFALITFVVGLILVGLLHAASFHATRKIFSQWRTNAEKFQDNQLDLHLLLNEDSRISGTSWFEYVFAYTSFASFIFASGVGGYSLIFSGG